MAPARRLQYCDNSCRGEKSVAPWTGGCGGGPWCCSCLLELGAGARYLGVLEGAGVEGVRRELRVVGEVPVVRGLWRGTQGVEEFLEPLVGHVPVGIGKVAPVLGQLQQGGEVGRLMDLGLW